MAEPIKSTFKEYGRGIIGGLLFSLPLLYTMEVWWTSFLVSPTYLLSGLIGTFILLIGFNTYAGMRQNSSFGEVLWDSVTEIGLGLIVSFLFLLLINKIGFTMSFDEIAGKVIVEAMIVAIGISVGTSQFEGDEQEEGIEDSGTTQNRFLKFAVLSICGAVLFGSSVAPTEEILIIALQSEAVHLICMVFLSLLLIAVILYFSNFRGATEERHSPKQMLSQVVICYFFALIVSFGFLYFFRRVADHSFPIVVAEVIVLGIATAIGSAVGRILISGN